MIPLFLINLQIEASNLLRFIKKTSPLLAQEQVAIYPKTNTIRSFSTTNHQFSQLYAHPTEDRIFKMLMQKNHIRNSFLTGVLGKEVKDAYEIIKIENLPEEIKHRYSEIEDNQDKFSHFIQGQKENEAGKIASNMRKNGLSIEQISKYIERSEEDVINLLEIYEKF